MAAQLSPLLVYIYTNFLQCIRLWLLLTEMTVPRRYFFCGSFILFLSCVCYAFVRVCSLMPCGHLLGKGWPLGSRLWCLIVSVLLSHWYTESCVVLDCIDSWFVPSFLLGNSNICFTRLPIHLVPLLHNTVLMLCYERDRFVKYCISIFHIRGRIS